MSILCYCFIQIDSIWADGNSAYRQIGTVCWKDFKTLQKRMTKSEEEFISRELKGRPTE